MNDTELNAVLDLIHADLRGSPAPSSLHERVRAIPFTTPQERGQPPRLDPGRFSMFSMVKLIAAGVIVALFGGFLLTSIFTMPQSDEAPPAAVTASPAAEVTSEPTEAPDPSVRTDILPGVALTVEEVDPGVFRVIDDGVRDLAKANNLDIVAGHDGGIWLLRRQRFFRLGGDEWHEWPGERPHLSDFEVAPDGTVWTLQSQDHKTDATIRSFDGRQWMVRHEAGANLEVTPDGTVWAKWWAPDVRPGQEGDTTAVFGYLDAEGWQRVGESEYGRLFVPGTGDIYATGGKFRPMLFRFIDGEWHDTGRQGATGLYEGLGATGVGPDGTVWTLGPTGAPSRFDGTEWQEWSLAARQYEGLDQPVLAVAPDRSLWVGRFVVDVTDVCGGGVDHFDGTAWSGYLSDLCVEAIEITADGSIWLLAREPGADLAHVYVITPEAAEATE